MANPVFSNNAAADDQEFPDMVIKVLTPEALAYLDTLNLPVYKVFKSGESGGLDINNVYMVSML